MLRGKELEAEACQLYKLIKGGDVQEVGLCVDNGCGSSPDRLVDTKGLLEVKCPILATHVGYAINNKSLVSKYFQQIQGQLAITGREWVDLFSYYPGMKTIIIRVERDEAFIEALQSALKEFCVDLDRIVKEIQ